MQPLGGAGTGLHSGVHWSLLLSVKRLAEVDSGLAPRVGVCDREPSGRPVKVDRDGWVSPP